MIVAHGGETVTPAGASNVQVIVNGDIINTPRGKQAVEMRDIRVRQRACRARGVAADGRKDHARPDRGLATGRTEFDITPGSVEAGSDWGDGAIRRTGREFRGRDGGRLRVPNRTVQIPLILRTGAARGSRRCGRRCRRRRRCSSVRAAAAAEDHGRRDGVRGRGERTLKLGGGWLQSAKDADLDATLEP